MKNILFSVVFAAGSIIAVQEQYYTKKINLFDDYELSQVAKILFYKEREVYSHTYYTSHIGYKKIETKATTKSSSNDGKTSTSTTAQEQYVPYSYEVPHRVYRSMNKEERRAELIRAKQEVIDSLQQGKAIFICKWQGQLYDEVKGVILAEHNRRRFNLAELIQVYVASDVLSVDSTLYSMITFAEKFYRDLSITGIAIDLRSKNTDFYIQNGYVQLSRTAMIANKFSSNWSYIKTVGSLAALAAFVGYNCADSFNNNKNETNFKYAVAGLSALVSLPLTSLAYDYMKNTVYYKAL